MDDINTHVAERLKRLRQAAHLSLEELGQRAGVSRGMLSQIETLKTNPTIAVVWKIARGLGVSFAELVGDEPRPPDDGLRLAHASDAEYLYSADKRFRSRPLLANVPGHKVELYELRLEPAAVEQAEAHPPGSFEQLFVTNGRLGLTLGEQRHDLGPGDALFFRADRPHRYETLGRRAFTGLSLILYAS